MHIVIQQLLSSVAVLVLFSFVIGLVFDRWPPGRVRRIAIGAVGGVLSGVLLALPAPYGGVVDGQAPILVVAGYFGGPVGALVALPIPLIARIEAGGPAMPVGVAALVAAATIGASIRAWHDRRKHTPCRSDALRISAATALLALAVPAGFGAGDQPQRLIALFGALLAWNFVATAGLMRLVINERARSHAKRNRAAEVAFFQQTDQVTADILQTQLHQMWHIHNRYGAHFAYMLVAIDDGTALQRAATRDEWLSIHMNVARIVRESVRHCDICAPVGADHFAVLLPYTGSGAILPVAKRMQAAVADQVSHGDAPVTVSIGIAHVDESNGPNDLIVLAENALVMANAVTPRNAIGPVSALEETAPPLIRSFPGALMTGPERKPSTGGSSTRIEHVAEASL
ncbi:MAG: diguanylate cyclase [Pseudomonadota bacterium]